MTEQGTVVVQLGRGAQGGTGPGDRQGGRKLCRHLVEGWRMTGSGELTNTICWGWGKRRGAKGDRTQYTACDLYSVKDIIN